MGDSPRSSIHLALGGDAVADVLLWKNWIGSLVVLVSSTIFWILFKIAGYNLLQFVANVLLLLVTILFFWAKSASILNRPLPPLPDLDVSEETFLAVAEVMCEWGNRALSIARDIAIGGDLKVLLQVVFSLWILSVIGGLFDFLTLIYVGVLLSLSVPVLYEKRQDQIDDKLSIVHSVFQAQYRKLDDIILSKIPFPRSKEKKTQ